MDIEKVPFQLKNRLCGQKADFSGRKTDFSLEKVQFSASKHVEFGPWIIPASGGGGADFFCVLYVCPWTMKREEVPQSVILRFSWEPN
jgi:hypothetical protein